MHRAANTARLSDTTYSQRAAFVSAGHSLLFRLSVIKRRHIEIQRHIQCGRIGTDRDRCTVNVLRQQRYGHVLEDVAPLSDLIPGSGLVEPLP